MFGVTPLRPAYGRDYKSKAEIEADLKANKDFTAANGQYINRDQLIELGLSSVQVRYGNNRKTTVVKV